MSITHEDIQNLIYSLGGSFVGFSDVYDNLPDTLKKYRYAITFGIRLSDAIIDEIDDKPTFNYFNHYRSVNTLIDQIGLRVLLLLQSNNYNAYTIAASQSIPVSPVPYSGILSHKIGAVLSGQGWIGKNNLFIHREYGPRVRLGTVLTDMVLPCGSNFPECKCSECNKCADICPASAIKGQPWSIGTEREELFDPKACSEYMNKNFKHIGRGSVCGLCIRVCPFGKK